MEVLLIRHSDPDYENDALTEIGHRKAQMLATHLVTEPLSAIYVSPLHRAQDTMRYTADIKKMSFTTLDWLREVEAPSIDGYAAWELPGTYVLGRSKLPDMETWSKDPLFGENFFPVYQKIAEGFDVVMHSHGYEKTVHMYRIQHSSNERIAFFFS